MCKFTAIMLPTCVSTGKIGCTHIISINLTRNRLLISRPANRAKTQQKPCDRSHHGGTPSRTGTFGLLIESSNPTEPNAHRVPSCLPPPTQFLDRHKQNHADLRSDLPGENITSPVERSSAEKNKCRNSPLCMHIVRSLSWKHEVKKNGATR
jgi:hypothetical protein